MGLGMANVAGVVENEDDTVFPGVGATCRSCRAEWLWRYALLAARVVRDPVGVSMGAPVSVGSSDFLDMTPGAPSARGEGEGGEQEREDERDFPLLHTPRCLPPRGQRRQGRGERVRRARRGQCAPCARYRGRARVARAQTRWTDMLRQAMVAKRWGAGEATTRGGHDYSQTVLATRGKERSLRADRDRQRSRARSASLESIDPYRPLTKQEEDQRYANTAANAAARGVHQCHDR
ncbi:hypothetical protein DFH09DRAFT_282716 [Mycena vulgaris]|nr:hypothetical protein DFH09DRAFT_282716 [Mycena vulgaris]